MGMEGNSHTNAPRPRLQLDFEADMGGAGQSFDVPGIATALVVAEINMAQGSARIRDGERLVATLKKREGLTGAPYWYVS